MCIVMQVVCVFPQGLGELEALFWTLSLGAVNQGPEIRAFELLFQVLLPWAILKEIYFF